MSRQSTATEELANSKDQGGMMDIVFQAKLERYLARKDQLDKKMSKAYSLTFVQYCNKTMQTRIEEHPDYNTLIVTR